MTPLNYLLNCSADLTQSPRFFHRQVSSRGISTLALPFEFMAVAENTIKLPFQIVACSIKLPITVLNVVLQSQTLRKCADALSSPKYIVQTALKIVGYAVGFFFTAIVGTLSPYQNFKIHCTFGLTTDRAAERERLLQEERRKQEIAAYEAVLAAHLHQIILAIKQQALLAAPHHEPPALTSEPPIQESSSPSNSVPVMQEMTTETLLSPEPLVSTIEASGTESEDIPVVSQEAPKESQETITESARDAAEAQIIPLETPLQELPLTTNPNQAVALEG